MGQSKFMEKLICLGVGNNCRPLGKNLVLILIPQSERLYKSTDSDYRRKFLEKFMRVNKCSVCDGKRLKQKILAVKINNKSIIDVTDLSIQEAIVFFNNLELTKQEEKIS